MSRLFSRRPDLDQDEDDDVTGKSAFHITKSKAETVNGIPVSGEDYVLLVRQQAKKCPGTVVAKAPPPPASSTAVAPSGIQAMLALFNTQPSKLVANEEWQDSFIRSFKSYQRCMQQSKKQSKKKLLPSVAPASLKMKNEWNTFCNENDPSAVASFTQPMILTLLQYHIEWLNNDMTQKRAQWIFALLVYLDPVMTAEHTSILRDLARKCIRLRDDQDQLDKVAEHNLIITIVAKVYGQADLQ